MEQRLELKPAHFLLRNTDHKICFQHKLYAEKLLAAVEKEIKLKQALF